MIVKKLSVTEIKPNNYNPNRMEQEQYESLKYGIQKYGMLQPILVRQDMTIIDGYHRWKASKEVGLSEIWAVVVESSHEEAKLKTIAFNNLRGSNDDELLGSIMDELTNYFSIDEIIIETGFTYDEMKDIFAFNDLDMAIFEEMEQATQLTVEDDGEDGQEKDDEDEKEKEREVQFSVSGLFGSKLIPKKIANKLLLMFEEIAAYDDASNDVILAHAIEKCRDKIRQVDINNYLEELKP